MRGLDEHGHEIYAAVRPRSPIAREIAARVRAAHMLELPLRNALDLKSARRLAQFITTHKVEIVHAHVARDYLLAALAVRRARLGGVRLVVTRHLLFPLNRITALIIRKRAARIIAVSEAVARVLREQNNFPAHKIRVVLNGVDIEAFASPARADVRSEYAHRLVPSSTAKRFVGIAGELRPHKGQEDFVRAAARVAADFPDVDFLIAGEDPTGGKEFRAHLETLIAEANLTARVHLTGWLEDLRDFYNALDVFVSASRIEPFGLVIAEAMASGAAAVVTTATDGAREIIDDNLTGKIVPIGDAQAMAKAISEILADEETRRRFTERAALAARERFSLARMVDETECIYREALNAAS